MKKLLLSLASIFLTNIAIALPTTIHTHRGIEQAPKPEKIQLSASSCLIKITNDSHYDVIVSGRFDDGSMLEPFMIYAYENPHFISLYYYNICHGVMDIEINTSYGLKLYDQETYVNSKIRVKSGWLNPYIVLENANGFRSKINVEKSN